MEVTRPRELRQPNLISVVIPALNCSGELRDQLEAVGAQVYEGDWEVVIVDNGSRDGTRELALGWLEVFEHRHEPRLAPLHGSTLTRVLDPGDRPADPLV